jgi:hypothetical protein
VGDLCRPKSDALQFLRDLLFNEVSVGPEPYWHRPILVTNMNARLGDVIGLMKMKPEHPDDDVIDQDLILMWGSKGGSLPAPIFLDDYSVTSSREKSRMKRIPSHYNVSRNGYFEIVRQRFSFLFLNYG